jgi:hypothetical protein
LIEQDREALTSMDIWESPPYCFEVNFRLSAARQQQLRPELIKMLHETFIDHPDYDAEHLPEFLQSDIYMRVFVEGELTGIFTADLFRTDGEPVLYLSVGLVTGHGRSGGNLMPLSMGLIIDLASQAFGLDDFFVALRTANPRVIAKLWQSRWVCFYPRRDWHSNDPRITNLRQHFCTQAFGADRCDLHGIIFYDIYPTPPWDAMRPWHHDETVNDFCRHHLRPQGLDAILFLGPTQPPFTDMPRGKMSWPLGPR